MTIWKRVSMVGAAAALLIGTSVLLPQTAEAREGGRGGFHGGGAVHGGFHGGFHDRGFHGGRVFGGVYFDPFFSFGWGPYGWPYYYGPYWGPYGGYGYGYGYEPRADLNAAMIAGYGGIDLKVKPNKARVWVDGKYYGEARDLDGHPTYLWLAEGAHQLKIAMGGYAPFTAKVDVRRGALRELKVRLDQGPMVEPVEPKAPEEPGTSS